MTYIPFQIPRDPEECPGWLYETLQRLNRSSTSASQGLASVTRGEAPDGSGNPLVDTGKFFYKPGLSGGQIAFGGVNSAENLVLSSTAATSKGFIYLGNAKTSMYDEANQRIGLNTIPLYRLHQKHSAVEKMQRWEGPGTDVTNCICNGTTAVTHATHGFAALTVGMGVRGSGVTEGTLISSITNDGSLSVSSSITTGTKTLTFYHILDLAIETNGSGTDMVFRTTNGLQIIGSSLSGGQGSAIRITAQTAIGALIRAFVEAGPGSDSMALTGTNGATGTSLHALFSYMSFNTWTGSGLSGTARVGINDDPFNFRSNASPAQIPGSLIVARRVGEATGVATMIVEGTNGSEVAFGIADQSIGSDPTKAMNSPSGGFRHDGKLFLCTGTTPQSLIDASNPAGGTLSVFQMTGTDTFNYMGIGNVTAWGDTLVNSRFMCLGDLIAGQRSWFLNSGGFSPFTRFGISSAYTLISNGQAGGASGAFPAPETTPSVCRILNTSTAGADGSVVLKLQTSRAGQTGDFLEAVNSSNAVVAAIQSDGTIYGPSANVFYEGDAVSYDDDAVFYHPTYQ
jgi:hypothetical protein